MSTENHVLDRYDFENEKLLKYNEIYDRIYNETLQDLDNITEQISDMIIEITKTLK